MKLRRALLPLAQLLTIAAAVPKSDEGIRASVAMEIQQQISNDIRNEFIKLQKELLTSIRSELANEVGKIKEEVNVKLDSTANQSKALKADLEKTLLAMDDLDIRIKTGQKVASDLMTSTTQNLVDQYYNMKTSVTEDLGSFKVELQQSKSHLENLKTSVLSEMASTLSAHTDQLYKSIDANQNELISKVNLMQVSLNKRVADYHKFALGEFNQRELTIGRKMKDQFNEMTQDLNLSLTKHQGSIEKTFDSKVDMQRAELEASEASLLGRVNSTMQESLDRMESHLNSNANKVSLILKDNENNINRTLSNQVEEIEKYIRPAMQQFTGALTQEMTNVKEVIENQFDASLEVISDIQIGTNEAKSDVAKLVTDATVNTQDTAQKFKTLENQLDAMVVRLNKSMNNEFYNQQIKLLQEFKTASTNTNTAISQNNASLKTLIDSSIVKSVGDALDVMKGQFEDIETKLSNIEDEEEDLIPRITDVVQNIVNDGVGVMKKNIEISVSTPLIGRLDTLQKTVGKIGGAK